MRMLKRKPFVNAFCVSLWRWISAKILWEPLYQVHLGQTDRCKVLALYFPRQTYYSTRQLMHHSVIFIIVLHSHPFAQSNSQLCHHSASTASRRQLLTFSTHWEPACAPPGHGYCSESGSERRPHTCLGVRDSKWVGVGWKRGREACRKGESERGETEQSERMTS